LESYRPAAAVPKFWARVGAGLSCLVGAQYEDGPAAKFPLPAYVSRCVPN